VAGPPQADETEQAMLDRIPLAVTRRTVAHGNDKAVDSGNGLVEDLGIRLDHLSRHDGNPAAL
jgi:hypothetical protein